MQDRRKSAGCRRRRRSTTSSLHSFQSLCLEAFFSARSGAHACRPLHLSKHPLPSSRQHHGGSSVSSTSSGIKRDHQQQILSCWPSSRGGTAWVPARSLDFRQHGTAVPAPQDQLFGKTRSGPGRRRRRHYSSGGGGAAAAAAGHGARWPKRPRQWRGTRTAAPRHRGQRMDNTLRLAIGSGSMSEGAAPTTSWCWLLVLVAAPDPPTDSMISCARTGFWLRRLYC